MFKESRSSSISGETAIGAPDELSHRLVGTSLGRFSQRNSVDFLPRPSSRLTSPSLGTSFQRLSNRFSPESSSRPSSEVPDKPRSDVSSKFSQAAKTLWHTIKHTYEHSYSFGFDTEYPPRTFFYDVDLESIGLEKRDTSTAPWYLSEDVLASEHMAHFRHEIPCTTVGWRKSRLRGSKHTRRAERPDVCDAIFRMDISVPYEASEPHTHIICKNFPRAAKEDIDLCKWLDWYGNTATLDSKLGDKSEYKKPISINRPFQKTIEQRLNLTLWNEGKRVKDLTAHGFTV